MRVHRRIFLCVSTVVILTYQQALGGDQGWRVMMENYPCFRVMGLRILNNIGSYVKQCGW